MAVTVEQSSMRRRRSMALCLWGECTPAQWLARVGCCVRAVVKLMVDAFFDGVDRRRFSPGVVCGVWCVVTFQRSSIFMKTFLSWLVTDATKTKNENNHGQSRGRWPSPQQIQTGRRRPLRPAPLLPIRQPRKRRRSPRGRLSRSHGRSRIAPKLLHAQLHLTNTGQYLNSSEATEVFFGVTTFS